MLSRRLLRIKVVKMLYAHLQSEDASPRTSEKNLEASIDKAYDLYHLMLSLITDVARYAEERIDLNRGKKLPTFEDLHPNLRFVENEVLAQITDSTDLGDYLAKRKMSWVQFPELIKGLYKSLVESDFYKRYMERDAVSYKEDRELVSDFYMRIVANNEQVAEAIEDMSIFWADDEEFALLMLLKTLDLCKQGQADLPLLPKYKNEDDAKFAGELFRATLAGQKKYLRIIEQVVQNWDMERVVLIDNIIITAAMAELATFESIPIKVTLDEYIEISKYYSTPGSSFFVNGILDKVVEVMETEKLINKSGRGLL